MKDFVKKCLKGCDSHSSEKRKEALRALIAVAHENQSVVAEVGGIGVLAGTLLDNSTEVKGLAAAVLARLALNHPANQELMRRHDVVRRLVMLLSVYQSDARRRAAEALTSLSLENNIVAIRENILTFGAIQPLVNMLSSGEVGEKKNAMHALGNFAKSGKDAVLLEMVKADVVGPLVRFMKTDCKDQDYLPSGLLILFYLSYRPVNRAAICETDVIPLLVGLLLSDNAGIKIMAAHILANIAEENLENQVAIIKAGALRPLVALLSCDDIILSGSGEPIGVKSKVVEVLAGFAKGSSENQRAITEADAIRPLVALLLNKDADVGEKATFLLGDLAKDNRENQDLMLQRGAVSPLVSLLLDERTSVSEGSAYCLGCISKKNLAAQEAIARAGAIPYLIQLLGKGGCEQKLFAAIFFRDFVENNPKRKELVSRAGVIPLLVPFLMECCSQGYAPGAYAALGAIFNLAEGSPTSQTALVQAGVIEPLVAVLSNSKVWDVTQALNVLGWLSERSPANQVAMVQAGVLQPLINSLDGASSSNAAGVMVILVSLASNGANSQAILSAGAIPLLTHLLSADVGELQKDLARSFYHLARNDAGRVEIVSAGAISPLVAWLSNEDISVKAFVAGTLGHLVSNSFVNQSAVVAAGAVPLLVALLEGSNPDNLQEEVVSVLLGLADNNPANQAVIVQSGALRPLVSLLASGCTEMKGGIVRIFSLIVHNNLNKAMLASVGVIPLLVSLLSDGNDEVKEKAAQTLAYLTCDETNKGLWSSKESRELIRLWLLAPKQPATWKKHEIPEGLSVLIATCWSKAVDSQAAAKFREMVSVSHC